MKKEKSGKIKRSRALKNNLYACSLLIKICPSLVVHQGVSRFLGYFEWLFYSAFFMRYVINSLETGESIGRTMSLAELAVITSMMVSTTWILIGFTESLTNLFKNGLFIEYLRTFLEYKDADILIMDEPSSALDPIAEYELNKAMESAAKGKTVFYISHRLSTTRDADRIILLENGRIAEEGNHESLLKKNGKYAEMWNVQAGRYKEEITA
ncbi:MAG: hypothetical protein K6E47_00615 [Lachnospiraceae bacterium]|nr:hypothetical protein [Lachnospiraceae bacterium]